MCTAILAFAAVSMLMSSPPAAAPGPGTSDLRQLVSGNTRFALELYAKLGTPGNRFVSPYSISTALAMTYAGARGETAASMAKVLHFDLPLEQLSRGFARLVEQVQKDARAGGNQLNVANALWAGKGEEFLKEYLATMREYFGAGLRQVDFSRPAEAAQTINRWIEQQTQDKIKDLIKPSVLQPGTALVLTNAIYFKGTWAAQFKKDATKDEPFHVSGDKTIPAPMMHQTADFAYGEAENCQAIELPYAGGNLSMVVLLPRQVDGLGEFEKTLTAEKLSGLIAGLRKQEVVLTLPRFKTTSEFRLDDALRTLGMSHVFSAADFSGMNGKRDLFVGAVLHKAFVDVNEEGTEAAAATGVIMLRSSAAVGRPTPVFRADHPFVFIIREARTGSILFLGRVVNPNAG